MAQQTSMGPAALVLSTAVARRYYFDGASKSEIAAELDLSRFKVARLLDQARDRGLVRIEIEHHGEIDLDLSLRLQRAFGLVHCVVVEGPDEDDDRLLRARLGRAGAELLSEITEVDDVLGLVWARSLTAMRSALTQLAPCTVVQMTGALSSPDVDESSVELVRDVARTSGGPAYCFYAPLIVPDAATAHALRTQPEIERALAMCAKVTKAVVGVGSWEAGQSTVADALTARERDAMHRLGVRAEVGGIQLDEHGAVVSTSLTDRLIAVDAQQLRAVPEVIALAYDARKAGAVRAAIRGGLVDSLVTHGAMARALLGEA